MTFEELNERIELLLSLPREHPSYMKYVDKYTDYLIENRDEVGHKYSIAMIHKLPSKIYQASQDKAVVLQEAINDLNVIRRASSIQLTRLPLASYLFARDVAGRFLKTIKPHNFIRSGERSLLLDVRFYQAKLGDFLSVMKNAPDVFKYYSRFRKTLIIYMMNNILFPEHVRPYKPVVQYLEQAIKKIDEKLSLVDQEKQKNRMELFGSQAGSGEITEGVMSGLMDGGISYFLGLQESSNPSDRKVADTLLLLSIATAGEPLHDFVYGLQTGAEIIYCRTRDQILDAQKLAQSMLNIYSPELLVKTAINTVYEIKTYKQACDKEAVMSVTKSNFDLLQAYGIINLETQAACEKQLEALLEGVKLEDM